MKRVLGEDQEKHRGVDGRRGGGGRLGWWTLGGHGFGERGGEGGRQGEGRGKRGNHV